MATTSNPLFEFLKTSFETVKNLDRQKVIDVILHFPQYYEIWWTNLLKESPQHVILETFLIFFIIWLVFIRRTVDPKKTAAPEKLSPKEIEWLLDTWEPEPLVPNLTPKQERLLEAPIIERIEGDKLFIRGKSQPVLDAATFDFLDLSKKQSVMQAGRDALDKYGCGSCGPRGFYGTIDQHLFFEEAVAKFMGTQEAILYSEGASATTSAIPAFSKRGDLLLVDEACSEPVMTGVNLSRSTVKYFKHNDMADLERLLKAVAEEDRRTKRDSLQQRRFIVVEGLYRRTGEICPLPKILELKEKYFYRLVLDETFSFGTIGKTGRGVTEYYGRSPSEVEVITFTLDTVLASVGGICIGTREIVDHQRLSGAGYCFSASLAPFLAASALEALKCMENESSLVTTLNARAEALHAKLSNLTHLQVISATATPIIHLTLKTAFQSQDLNNEAGVIAAISDECFQNGVAVVYAKHSFLSPTAHLRPSLMVVAHVSLDDAKIAMIADTIAAAAKKVLKA